MTVVLQDVPAELRDRRQWVVWRLETRKGKLTKLPYCATGGGLASSTDSTTWTTHARAATAWRAGGFDGVGFVFTADDPYTGIDLDHCRDAATGEILPGAQSVMDDLGPTYAEASQSGTGVHLILRGELPADAWHKVRRDGFEIEVYDRGRYFCTTGQRIGDVSEVCERQAQLEALIELYAPVLSPSEQERAKATPPPLDDEQLIEVAMRASNGNGFGALWRGDMSAYGDDHSSADLALLCHLAFYLQGDPARMDAAFRRSSLYRTKWDRTDYRERSIGKAVERNGGKYYTGSGKVRTPPHLQPATPPLEDCSDAGNAAVFVRLMGDRIRHVAAWDAWLVYDGRRWARDQTHEVEALMGEALLTRFEEAAQAPDAATSKRIAAWAVGSRSAAKRAAALQMARSDRRIAARAEDFDRDLYRLNCQNGTLNLRTGQLRPHDSADLITKVAPVEYDPEARSDLWERVLTEATDADEELQEALQRVAGYCLTGDTGEEVFFLFHGPEATIKSTFLGALSATLGDYAMAVDPEVFLRRAHVGGPRDDVAGMEGARLVVCAEFDRGGVMAEAQLKQLTGGDTVRARHLYQAAREFRFTAKIAMHSNRIPKMSDDDGAVFRRLWAIEFNHTVPEEKRDPMVKTRLCDPQVSGPAILAWAVRGCTEWQKRGLGKPPAVKYATQAVRLSMDPLSDFLGDCCSFEPNVWTSSGDLRGAYEHWAKASNRKDVVGMREWGRRLSGRGLENAKRGHSRGWIGVRLVDSDAVESSFDLQDTVPGSGAL